MPDIDTLIKMPASEVRPLRNPARKPAAAVQHFSVDELKNGRTMDFGAALNGASGESDGSSLRTRYLGTGPPVKRAEGSQVDESDVPLEERISKLKKIRKSAVEYESFFVDHLVKQMRQSPLAKMPGGDIFSDIAEKPFRDMLTQAGGLGLADTITAQVARQENLERTLHDHPGIMGAGWRPDIAPNLMKNKAGSLAMPPDPTAAERLETAKTSARAGLASPEEFARLDQEAGQP